MLIDVNETHADAIDDTLAKLPSGPISCDQASRYWTNDADYQQKVRQARAVAAFDRAADRVARALLGAGLTAFYMSRLFFMIFHGKQRWTTKDDLEGEVHPHESGWLMTLPLIILSVFSLGLGGLLLLNDALLDQLLLFRGRNRPRHRDWNRLRRGVRRATGADVTDKALDLVDRGVHGDSALASDGCVVSRLGLVHGGLRLGDRGVGPAVDLVPHGVELRLGRFRRLYRIRLRVGLLLLLLSKLGFRGGGVHVQQELVHGYAVAGGHSNVFHLCLQRGGQVHRAGW